MRVLCVDDDLATLELVARLATAEGCTVEKLNASEDFDAAFKTFNPDIVIMEVVMPDRDGIDLISQIASEAQKTRVIVLSANNPSYLAVAKSVAQSKELTFIETMTKPISPRAFKSLLKKAIAA